MKSNSPSSTALLIGKSIVFTSKDPLLGCLLPEDFRHYTREILRAALGTFGLSFYEVIGKLLPIRFLVRFVEKLTVPGMSVHYILRKRQIDEWIQQVAHSGSKFDQLVVIGAGLDTLGIRAASKWPNIKVFEIDHPATQVVKRDTMRLKYVEQPENFFLVPSDLSKKSLEATLLEEPGFSYSENTIFLAEGLFMYLSLDAVGKTIDILRKFTKGQCGFIFSYMDLDKFGNPSFVNQGPLVNFWLSLKKEVFAWGSHKKSLEAFVNARGFQIVSHVTGEDIRLKYLSDRKFSNVVTAQGENLIWIHS